MEARVPFSAVRLRVRGLVQGVGFRPHVWRLAQTEGLVGSVRNDGAGVLIEVAGAAAAIGAFRVKLEGDAPALSRIEAVEAEPWEAGAYPDGFTIEASEASDITTGILPDAATCPDCLADILDPQNRRYRYPFTNCTHCGPRLSIVRALPYDRDNTSMSAFPMCKACEGEYTDPADRRFHAQPNACHDCGPKLWLEKADGEQLDCADPIDAAAQMLRDGGIIALKGLGGFHLACDAASASAVSTLRARKRRDAKPLAVMVTDMSMARVLGQVERAAQEALESAAAPIVLVPANPSVVAPDVLNGHDHIGLMLPYTPLHHLLMRAVDRPLVMTSGNLSDEPQVIDNDRAHKVLSGIADGLLLHNRDILNRVDDSIGRVDHGRLQLLRRARGYAPAPLPYPPGFRTDQCLLAMGAQLKSTFALSVPDGIVLSQHCGDLDHPAALKAYGDTIALFERLHDAKPDRVVVDRHRGYASTELGHRLATDRAVPLIKAAHHHAHIASVLGENGHPADGPPVVGIALDGIGLGPDDTLWGAEVLLADYRSAERLSGLPAIAMPGGDRCAREPWRNLVAHLHEAGLDPQEAGVDAGKAKLLAQMIDRGVNAPKASSTGRLFDAFAALLTIHADSLGFEGQAAMALEACARSEPAPAAGYPLNLKAHPHASSTALRPFWEAALADKRSGVPPTMMARKFHAGLASGVAHAAIDAATAHGVTQVALSGGVFANQLLTNDLVRLLEEAGLEVLTHAKVPCNDGGLAYGQALIALATDS